MSVATQVRANVGRLAFGVKYLLRAQRGKRQVLSHLASPSTKAVPMADLRAAPVTNLCNLRCKMCGQWGDTGIYRGHGLRRGHRRRARARADPAS